MSIAPGDEIAYDVFWEWLEQEQLTSDLNKSIIASDPNGFITEIDSHIRREYIFPNYQEPFNSFSVHLKIPENTPAGEYSVSTLHHSTFGESRNVRNDWTDVIRITVTAPDIKLDILGKVISHIEPNYGITEENLADSYFASSRFVAKGYTADGNSRLLVRIRSDSEGPVSLEIPELSKISSKIETLQQTPCDINSIYLESIPGKDFYQKTLVLIAPESWPSGSITESSIPFSIVAKIGEKESPAKSLILKKTPVVLIHGLWSNGASFNGIRKILVAGGFYILPPQNYDNWQGPSKIVPRTGYKFFNDFISPTIDTLRAGGIECTRVDIVGHSMGGLMAKKFLMNRYFTDSRSYGQGIVRRIITLGTPHLGSPLASFLIGDYRYLPLGGTDYSMAKIRLFQLASTNVILTLGGTAVTLKMIQSESALSDISINSIETQRINSGFTRKVPIFAIAGNTGRWGILLRNSVEFLSGLTHKDLFCDIPALLVNPLDTKNYIPEDSDTIVGISSAIWKGFLPLANIKTIPNIGHMGMGDNASLALEITSLLVGPTSAFYKANSVGTITTLNNNTARANNSTSDSFVAAEDIPEPIEAIVLTANQSTLAPGGSLRLSAVVPAGKEFDAVLLLDGTNINEMTKTDSDTYELTVTLPDDYSGVKRYAIVGFSVDESFSSNIVEVVVKPNLALSKLNVPNGPNFVFSAGLEYNLAVEGEFSDGSVFDVTNSKLGTTYDSDNPSIATVTEDGILKAITPGKTLITVRNGTVGALIYLDIVALEIDEESVVKKPALAEKIAEAKALLSSAGIGDKPGQYPKGAYDALAFAIANAEAVYDDEVASPDSIAAAVENLQNEIDTFKGFKNGESNGGDNSSNGGGCSVAGLGLCIFALAMTTLFRKSGKR
ncbi:hypothetical protein FACS1894187_21880 [Synergistales bacterium]|nr:hypothetical protein FACS1894187_21880 [Synergistales bacterium]